ncbi:MAG: erythromycin esterase family protein [Balneolales bacterium]|nr:erythromycin esterase family protein [Balneolales bacterium]
MYLLRQFISFGLITIFIAIAANSLFADSNKSFSVETESENLPDWAQLFDEGSIADIARLASPHRAVLLGEASHGTSEFYTIRAALSKELIREHGFSFIVVEGDWEAAWAVNSFVKGKEDAPATAEQALDSFQRWPQWMWNNEETLALIRWMREWNDKHAAPGEKIGFYGMDIYGYNSSIQFLANLAPQLQDMGFGTEMRVAMHCMNRHRGNQRAYLESVARTGEHCGSDLRRLVEILEHADVPAGFSDSDWLHVVQQARVVRQADLHLRGMLRQGPASWNERASNFQNTLEVLLDFYGDEAKGIAWAHNTHIGDARATEMSLSGMHNIGQLARIAFGEENVFALGFGTFRGTVKAGFEWEGPMRRVTIPHATDRSVENMLFNLTGTDQSVWINLRQNESIHALQEQMPHRAIGVVYDPAMDARQNYVGTNMPGRYDAFIFIPETEALNAR